MIILDNTALSDLAHIDRLEIPTILFGEAYIPECVYYEGVLGNFRHIRLKPFITFYHGFSQS
jgi:predicted nucleic acid-binding protein